MAVIRATIAVDCLLLQTPKITSESVGVLRAGDVVWIGAECDEWVLTRGGWLPRGVIEDGVALGGLAANEPDRLTMLVNVAG